MIRSLVCLATLSILLGGCICVHETQRVCDEQTEEVCVRAEERGPAQLLRHVVLFRFKEGTSAEDIRRIESAFCALPSEISAVYDFEWGTDVSVENVQKGFTHCFVVTFLSEADRSEYLPHPAHQEFGTLLKPHLGDVLVIDYWAN